MGPAGEKQGLSVSVKGPGPKAGILYENHKKSKDTDFRTLKLSGYIF